MSKRLTQRGYAIPKAALTPVELEAIKDELTVSPYVPKDFQIPGTQPPRYSLYLESANTIYLPKAYGLKKFGEPDVNKMPEGADIDIAFNGDLRPEQLTPCNAFLTAARDLSKGGGGILNLPCGSGKTVLGLYIACQLRKRTLIIVHKDFLLQQWRERIAQFIPHARVGLIKGKLLEIEDRDIVLGSLQSISMKEYPDDTFSSFGLLIVDECHHTSAEVFSQALMKASVRYSLGLSATLNRKDGLSRVFKWFLGDIVHKASKRPEEDVRVVLREYFDPHPAYSQEHYVMRDKLNTARMINNICSHAPRADFLVKEVEAVLREEPQRRVLILSDRREHLLMLLARLRERLGVEPGLYYGGIKQEQLKDSERCSIILGTFQFVAEGFDVPGLDTLVIASPKSDVVQAVGRILREKPERRKHVPLIIDIVDCFSLFERQGAKRKKYYKSCGYAMEGDVNNDTQQQQAKEITNMFQGKCCLLPDA